MTLHRIIGTGLPNVFLKNGFDVEGDGDDQVLSYTDLDGLYFSVAGTIARHVTPLSGAEFKFLRRRMGMSQGQVGAQVGKSEQAIAKWEKGHAAVPVADGNMIRLIWLSQHDRREVVLVVDRIARGDDDVPGDYVFMHNGACWIDCKAHPRVVEMVNSAGEAATEAIRGAQYTSAAVRHLPIPVGKEFSTSGGVENQMERTI